MARKVSTSRTVIFHSLRLQPELDQAVASH
jgi:hypothetical protein